jgi:glycosyltransferase involved in cell wall biosynthesis
MKIALIGTRGIPANYGGFETCAEEIAVGLSEKGHDISVYCRYGNALGNPKSYKGVELIYIPAIKTKQLGTLSHAFFSVLHAMFRNYDVLMVFNAGNSLNCIVPRFFGKKIAINVDGLEWKRRKWGFIAKQYFLFAERISSIISHRVVSDARAIQKYYAETYRCPSTFIAYGAKIESAENPSVLDTYGVKNGEYFFVASRLEPENNADITVEAFESVKTDKKLLIAGGANYKSSFITNLMKTTDARIKFLGPIYTPGHIKELHCGAYAYVHGNEVGGTNPALLKALGYGNCVLAYNGVYNTEVVGSAALLYEKSVEDLREKMQFIIDHPEVAKEYRKKAVIRIRENYTWHKITASYECMFKNIMTNHYKNHKESD